jgi:hypothetical protein
MWALADTFPIPTAYYNTPCSSEVRTCTGTVYNYHIMFATIHPIAWLTSSSIRNVKHELLNMCEKHTINGLLF